MKALAIFVGLLVGNFLVQWWKVEPQFMVAVERSYFQGMALLTYWVLDRFFWRNV
jgi:hypothetical protein